MKWSSGFRTAFVLAWVAAFLLTTFAPKAKAQVLYGQLVGVVQDPSGSMIGNAKVSIVNKGTGLSRETQTDEFGRYTFTTMPTGSYDVTVNASGFKSVTQTGVDVTVDNVRTLDILSDVDSIPDSFPSCSPRAGRAIGSAPSRRQGRGLSLRYACAASGESLPPCRSRASGLAR